MKQVFRVIGAIGGLVLMTATALMATEDSPPREAQKESTAATATQSKGKEASGKVSRLEEIVVTATKYEIALKEVPASMTVITHEQLTAQHLSSGDIGDALRTISGISVAQAGSPFVAGINMRGASSSGTMILVNGVPTNGEITQTIPVANIERIEIMRGPASALYGANATGGVVNIITKEGGEGIASSVGGGAGTFNTWRIDAASNGTIDKFHYSMSSYREGSDGTNTIENNVLPNNHMIDDCPYDKWAASLTTSYDLPDKGKISWLYNFFHDEYTRGRPNVGGDWDRHFTTLMLDQPLGERFLFKGYVGYRYDDLLHLYDNGGTNYQLKQKRYTIYSEIPAELQLTSNLGGRNVLTTGYFSNNQRSDMRYKRPDGSLIGDQNYKVRTQAGYLQDVWNPIDPLSVTLGLRYDHWKNHDTKYYNFITTRPASRTESNWSPKVGLKYNFADTTSVWANYAVGFIPPSPDQLYNDRASGGSTRQPNPNLKPETTQSYELGVERWFAQLFQARITGFYSYTEDKISSWFNANNVWINENIGRSKSYGVELDLLCELNQNWALSANYTCNRATIEKNPGSPSQEGNELTYSPKHKANVGVTYTQPKSLDVSVFARYLSEQQTNDDNLRYTVAGEERFMRASLVVDLKATKHIAINSGPLKQMDVSLSVDNVFDETYRTNYVYEDPGTVYYFETKLCF